MYRLHLLTRCKVSRLTVNSLALILHRSIPCRPHQRYTEYSLLFYLSCCYLTIGRLCVSLVEARGIEPRSQMFLKHYQRLQIYLYTKCFTRSIIRLASPINLYPNSFMYIIRDCLNYVH